MTSKTYTIADMKTLTIDQYERARSRALDRVKARIGERPTREQFKRELGAIATPLDWIALVVFVAALAISSLHIIHYMGEHAAFTPGEQVGIAIDGSTWAVVHQVGAILLAESAAILFMTAHSMSAPARAARHWSMRWVSIPLLLALTAAVFVFVANLSSGVGLLIGLMPPLFTLGIAVRLEAIIVEVINRREQVNRMYLEALAVFEDASADPQLHPQYKAFMKQELWAALISLKANESFREAPSGFRAAAVARELQRDEWMDAAPVVEFIGEVVKPKKEVTEGIPFGSSAQEQAEPEFMLTMPADSAPIARGNGNGHHES